MYVESLQQVQSYKNSRGSVFGTVCRCYEDTVLPVVSMTGRKGRSVCLDGRVMRFGRVNGTLRDTTA